MKTIVVGGGATGMSVGFLLSRIGRDVELYEAADRVGGLLNTFDVGNGRRLEYFYHHFFTHDAEINWLIDELGLQDAVRFENSTMAVYRHGRCYPFNGLGDLLHFRAMGLWGRFRFGWSSARLAYGKGYTSREDQSALEWFYAHAGREATDAIWRPMLEVKFGAAADQIPLAWIAGRLRQRVLSRKSGREKLGYLDGSLQQLTDRLQARLLDQGVKVHTRKQVQGFQRLASGRIRLRFTDGMERLGDRVVFTIPTDVLARLWEPRHDAYARQLASIEYLGAICTVLSFPEALSDAYWTNMADGDCDFGGVIEQTRLVPPSHYGNQHLVYLSRYALADDPIWKFSDQELVNRQVQQLEKVYRRPLSTRLRQSWVFRSRTAAPVTDRGFRDRVPLFRSSIPGVYVASMCHLYPEERSVNNSIRVAAELLRAMDEHRAADLVPTGISEAGLIGHAPIERLQAA